MGDRPLVKAAGGEAETVEVVGRVRHQVIVRVLYQPSLYHRAEYPTPSGKDQRREGEIDGKQTVLKTEEGGGEQD